jgi:hypothetical protein
MILRAHFMWIVAALLPVVTATAQNDPGRVYYQRLASPDLDPYTNQPNASERRWLTTNLWRMGVFSPYFDTKTSWYPNSLAYLDLYGIQRGSWVQQNHPEWILHDQNGNLLYIPWGCGGGTCPQYAADIANPAFRTWWISQAESVMSHGYLGLWIDDVNMEFRVSNGQSNPVAPIDSNTGQPMTWDAWRNYVATFVEQIRKAFPSAEISHNVIWNAGPAGVQDADPAIQREIAAADIINLERGIGSEPRFTGGNGPWSLSAFFSYIDRVHALGRGVTLEEYTITPPTQQYALAGYFLISSGKDRIGDGSNPDTWWTGFDVRLGAPLGPRTYANGIFRRDFSDGTVLLAEPGLAETAVPLSPFLVNLDGSPATSIALSGGQGIVLLAKQTVLRGRSISGSFSVSDLNWSSAVSGWGPVERDMSNGGLQAGDGQTLTLNGVQYAKGLGVHANSEIHFALAGICSSFSAQVGIDDEIPVGLGSVIFQVFADGVKLYDSGKLTSGGPPGVVFVNLTGRQDLSLVVTETGNTNYDDHADWADAKLVCSPSGHKFPPVRK